MMLVSRRQIVALSASASLLGPMAVQIAARQKIAVADFRDAARTPRQELSMAVAEWSRRGGMLTLDKDRNYDLGDCDRDPIFPIAHLRDAVLDGNGASLTARTMTMVQSTLFLLQDCRNVAIRNLSTFDQGADISLDWRGMRVVVADGSLGPCSGLVLDNIYARNAVALFVAQGGDAASRVSEITLRHVTADHCYYGINCAENGDRLVGALRAINCRRAYFVYGISDHRVRLDISHDGSSPGAQACCLIKRYQRDTRMIMMAARFSGVLAWQDLVKFEHQPAPASGPSIIEDVDARIDVMPGTVDRNRANRFAISAYRGSAPLQSSDDVWRNIRIGGMLGANGGDTLKGYVRPTRFTEILLDSDATDIERISAVGVRVTRKAGALRRIQW